MSETVIYNHQPRQASSLVLERIRNLKVGQKMQDLPEELWHDSFRFYMREDPNRQGGPNLRMIRLDPDQPSLTVTGYIYNKFVHPFEDRFITPREAARLQGFPDDFEFKGTLTSVQRQIGDAVPIELGEALFRAITDMALRDGKQQLLALSLFSGAGGLDLAALNVARSRQYGLQTLACVEIEPDRCQTLQNYFGHDLRVIQADISKISVSQVLDTIQVKPEHIHLIYGGPPCQSFSQAGKQKGTADSRGELIFDFLRFVEEIAPPMFLMENVANLQGIDNGTLIRVIRDKMNKMGYSVEHQVLNAAFYGTAQYRRRMIFLGVRRGVGASLAFPSPTHDAPNNIFRLPTFRTVRDAFVGLPPA